jgi:hypothetical protein
MKATCAAIIGILALFFSACVTGDKITSYVIDSDGSIYFSIYRFNLLSDQTGDAANKELADFIKKLEERQDDLFTELMKGNAKEVEVAVLRKTSPAAVLITGRIPSLNDFAAYLSEEDEEDPVICTAISSERARGLLCELTRKQFDAKAQPETDTLPAYPSDEMRFALAEGVFTNAQGFLLSNNKRSAILDQDALSQMLNSQAPTVTLSLEWEITETP